MDNMRSLLAKIFGVVLQPLYPHVRRIFWDIKTNGLIKKYRTGAQAKVDYHIYRAYLERMQPKRLLDIGCGSGRLFPLYNELMIPEVVGIDISPRAISKCPSYPNCGARVMKVENLNFPPNYFDAVISNAVLRHVPPGPKIAKAMSKIAEQSKSILLREPIVGKGSYHDFRHDYETLFRGKMRLDEHYQDGLVDILIFMKDVH